MTSTLLDGLITSKTRIRILMRLFLDPARKAYLRGLATELGVAPSQMREELQHLEKGGLLTSEKSGRQIFYRANAEHALFPELQSMVRKALGMDRILESVLRRLGDLEEAYVVGDYAEGRDSGIIDLVLIGRIREAQLSDLVGKTERHLNRRLRTLVFEPGDRQLLQELLGRAPALLLWQR